MIKKSRSKWGLLLLGIIVLSLSFWPTEHWQGQVQFGVSGTVYDKASGNPLKEVEVVLVLSEEILQDAKKLDDYFAYDRLMGTLFNEKFGLTGKDGNFSARLSKKYGDTVFWLVETPKHPFSKAWVVYRKAGYLSHTQVLDTENWRMSFGDDNGWGDVYNPLPPVSLVSNGP
ncbi:MAG: hypothetical protein HQM13_13275 [SAR324 cluster bacterium]|nr:hypothetical protein [SAR324 cluster bacterium]